MCKCKNCGKEEYKIDTKKFPKEFCSYNCYESWLKFNKTPNCTCAICGISMYLKPSRINRVKNGITCSKKCSSELKSLYMKDVKNHQYGLTGDKNSSYAGDIIMTNYGYILEYCPNHPYPHDNSNKCVRVLQHRLVIERNNHLFNPDLFENINDHIVLKKDYDVHHINEIKSDNRLENLQVLTRSEHTKLHNEQRFDKLNKYKEIIVVLKQGELLETPEADNQQPSLSSNTFEGSETNSRIQTSNVEDSNTDTSALLQKIIKIIGDDIVRTIL
jgi:hypothetical protein